MERVVPIQKDIVLIGGGHSHVAVLRSFGMKPIPGVRLTLISATYETPYSGMLPGFLAGHYRIDESHINLSPLCQFARAQFYRDRVTGLDPQEQIIHCAEHPPVRYDLVSIDIGSTPQMASIPGASDHAIPVKPVDQFLHRWQEIEKLWAKEATEPRHVCVVGGGAGGVELTLSLQHRLSQLESSALRKTRFSLVTASSKILPTHNDRVQATYDRILRQRGVELLTDFCVQQVREAQLQSDQGTIHDFDALLWVTHASAPAWPRESGIQVDQDGFIEINTHLQSTSHPNVFAAGDIASMSYAPRPKSGVFAVRQGPPLTRNLRRAIQGETLIPYHPQQRFLSLISTGNQFAVASRGSWMVQGAWVWRWKDWIDRRFMRRYQELPAMKSTPAPPPTPIDANPSRPDYSEIRCTGCGSKVSAGVLARVLKRLKIKHHDSVAIGLEQPDDAAVLTVAGPGQLVQTVDYFPAFLDDPWLFGRVATLHCLSDVIAMGCQPHSAQMIATLPYAHDRPSEETLFQVMSGALEELDRHGASLVGGHTLEGNRLAMGMTVNALEANQPLWTKGGLKSGDRLVLTKALGTGMVLAAHMRGQTTSSWIEAAIRSMLQSNAAAIDVLRQHHVRSTTDITGFGLIGHLTEMLTASGMNAEIRLAHVPLLPGVEACSRLGIESSLAPANRRRSDEMVQTGTHRGEPAYAALFDPQTSGGLLFGVDPDRVEDCVRALKSSGCPSASEIGFVTSKATDTTRVSIVD